MSDTDMYPADGAEYIFRGDWNWDSTSDTDSVTIIWEYDMEEVKVPQVTVQMEELQNNVNTLIELVHVLEKGLAPVLSSRSKDLMEGNVPSERKQDPHTAPLAETLQEQNESLKRLTRKLDNLLTDLEI